MTETKQKERDASGKARELQLMENDEIDDPDKEGIEMRVPVWCEYLQKKKRQWGGIERSGVAGEKGFLFVGWLVGCLTSQQHASVSQGRICSDKCTCCHTEREVADQTFLPEEFSKRTT